MSIKCAVCNKNTIALFRRKIANNEVVCQDCSKLATAGLTIKQVFRLKHVTSEEIRRAIIGSDEVYHELKGLKHTKSIDKRIYFYDEQEKILIISLIQPYVLNYSDIKSFEVLRDNKTEERIGVGRAMVGGMLFGQKGAIIGAVTGKDKVYCNSLRVMIETHNTKQPYVGISFINKKTKIGSNEYELALIQIHHFISALQLILDKQKNELDMIINVPKSIVNEKKSKELLDKGTGQDKTIKVTVSIATMNKIKNLEELLNEDIITKEEFDKKVIKLLELN